MTEERKVNGTCRYHGCDRPLYDETNCIFHSVDNEKMEKGFEIEFSREHATQSKAEQSFNFKDFVFPPNWSFKGFDFEKNVSFYNAIFTGPTSFFSVSFSGEAIFSGVTFNGDVDFGRVSFLKDVHFAHAKFLGKAVFENTVFAWRTNFYEAEFSSEVSFKKACFETSTELENERKKLESPNPYTTKARWCAEPTYEVSFERTKYPKDVTFEMALFHRPVRFSQVTFGAAAKFKFVEFRDWVTFINCEFIGCIDFLETISKGVKFTYSNFKDDASFRDIVFSEYISFNITAFDKNANFSNAKLGGEAVFNETAFKNDAIFDNTTFKGKTSFTSCKFSVNVSFDHAIFNGAISFRDIMFGGLVKIDNSKFESQADFAQNCVMDMSKVSMVDTYFYEVRGLIEKLENSTKQRGTKKTKTEVLSDRIKILLDEKAASRYPVIARRIKDDWFLMDFKEKHPKLFKAWYLTANCGRGLEGLLRWTSFSIALALLFAIVFTPPPDFFPDWWINICNEIGPRFEQTAASYRGKPLNFWSSLYFSIVTFTTLGFGDVVTANSAARVWVTVEVIMGYVMLGGLISIFANILARRS